MEFDPRSQLPPSVAAQFARVGEELAEQQHTATTPFKDTRKYPDVETFLEQHAEIFSTTEGYWGRVNDASKAMNELSGMRVMAEKEQVDEQGKLHIEYKQARGANRASQRKVEGHQGLNTRLVVAQMNQMAYTFVSGKIAEGLFVQLPESYRLRDIADSVIGFTMEGPDSSKAERDRRIIEGKPLDELAERSEPLLDAFMRAFLGQSIGIHLIRNLLADDRHVLPFVDRLQETATLSSRGSVEFPGLLETVQAHIGESAMKKRENAIESALRRISGTLFSRYAFVSAILDPESESIIPPGRKLEKEFMGCIETAQALAVVLGRKFEMTPGEIAKHIGDHFDQMPEQWQVAYGQTMGWFVDGVWDRLALSLRPFYRSGRLPSNVNVSSQRRPASESAAKSVKRGRLPKGKNPQQPLRDPSDLVTQPETEPEETTFAILKSTGSGSRKVCTIDRVESLDGLMQTSMVTDFLQKKPGLSEDLKTFLQAIVDDPYRRSKPMAVKGHVRIKDDGAANALYSIRGYSPRKGAVEGGTSHELASRVRIFFAISVVDGKRCIAIEEISLRDGTTYSN